MRSLHGIWRTPVQTGLTPELWRRSVATVARSDSLSETMKPSTATKRDLLWRRRDREVFRGLWREIKRLRLELYTLRQTRRDNTGLSGGTPAAEAPLLSKPMEEP